MPSIDALTDGLLRTAARRWPAEIRDDQAREWAAELHMVRNDDTGPRLTRSLRTLWFALSLAASPPIDDDGVPRGWRELVPQAGMTVLPWLVLLGAGILVSIMGDLRPFVLIAGFLGLRDDPFGTADDVLWQAMHVGGALPVLAVLWWLGAYTGRRRPLVTAPRGRFTRLLSVALVPVLLSAGGFALHLWYSSIYGITWRDVVTEPLWIVLIAPVAGVAVRLARKGRRLLGALAGIGGSLLVFELLAVPLGAAFYTRPPTYMEGMDPAELDSGPTFADVDWSGAPLWFPFSLVDNLALTSETGPSAHDVALYLEGTMTNLLNLTAFALGYAIAASRSTARRHRLTLPVTAAAAERIGFRTVAGLGIAGAALAVWSVLLTWTTPHTDDIFDAEGHPELGLWSWDLRQGLILAAVLAFAYALTGRHRAVFPALLAAVLLLVTDGRFDAAGARGIAATAWALAIGLVVLTAAWWVPRVLDRPAQDALGTRRSLAWIAVTAAVCSVAPFMPAARGDSDTDVVLPRGLVAGCTTVAVLLALVATLSALASRDRPLRTAAAVPFVAVPVVVLGLLGTRSGAGEPWLSLVGMFGVTFAVYVLAVAVPMRRPVRFAGVLRRAGLGAAIIVAGAVAQIVCMWSGFFVANLFLILSDYGVNWDGLPWLHGTLMLGIVVAFAGTRWPAKDARADGGAAAATKPAPSVATPAPGLPAPSGSPHPRPSTATASPAAGESSSHGRT